MKKTVSRPYCKIRYHPDIEVFPNMPLTLIPVSGRSVKEDEAFRRKYFPAAKRGEKRAQQVVWEEYRARILS